MNGMKLRTNQIIKYSNELKSFETNNTHTHTHIHMHILFMQHTFASFMRTHSYRLNKIKATYKKFHLN